MRAIGCFIFTLFLLGSATAHGQVSKAELAAQLVQTGEQITQAKSAGLSPAQIAQLLDQYAAASAGLGGDDPYGLLGLGGTGGTRTAPAAPPQTTPTTTPFTISPGAAIPDGPGGMLDSDLAVSGVDPWLWDVDLTIDITHTFAADLEIALTSPAGTVVVITTDNGAGNDDVFSGSLFDDQADTPVTLFAYSNGVTATPLIPEGALGAFIGEDPNGTWTLSIIDDAAADTGTLNSWSLDITTLDQAPVFTGPDTFTMATGAAIPDGPGGFLSETQTVSGLEPFVCDFDITLDITHTFAADLEVFLIAPDGTETALTVDAGGGNDNVFSGSLFDDSAPIPVTDFPHADNVTSTPLAPQGALAAFHGLDPNGDWTLEVTDDAAADTGNLNSWSLDISTCAGEAVGGIPESVPVPALSRTGLLSLLTLMLIMGGIALASRRAV